MGWVNRGKEKDMLERRLEDESIQGQIVTVEDFQWKKAGGRCSRGNVSIL